MSRRVITLFMWGYQEHFRFNFEYLLDSTLAVLGARDAGGACLLVGAKIPGAQVEHEVCVEPEDGPCSVALFAGMPAAIEKHITEHPLQRMFYGDEPSMRDKPENIRRDSIRQAVQDALASYDVQTNVRSFAGRPAPVDGYYVVPVLQLPQALFTRYPPLREPVTDGRFTGSPSLVHAVVGEVLKEAHDELLRPDPGRSIGGRSASPMELARRAASNFMYAPQIAIRDRLGSGGDLFERFNLISSLMYEGSEGKGRMLLAKLDGGAIDVSLQLAEPVPFHEARWARKVLQMASSDTALLANTEHILGLGSISAGTNPRETQNVFEVEFHDHYHWSISSGGEVLLISRYGAPSLPNERIPMERLFDTFRRLFPEVIDQDVDAFAALFEVAVNQRHGSMLVVASDAETEAERLSGQGTKIVPVKLTPELYRRVSNIDGTIIIDPKCICHAVGVILDGPANEHCTPSRGARYNSGIRYVAASDNPRLAVVVSDDRTVDVIPLLRPRIRRSAIEEHLAKLEASTIDDYHPWISWLDEHRFYLRQVECDRVNAVYTRLRNAPREVGAMMIIREKFHPNPACTTDYFESEGLDSNDDGGA